MVSLAEEPEAVLSVVDQQAEERFPWPAGVLDCSAVEGAASKENAEAGGCPICKLLKRSGIILYSKTIRIEVIPFFS